jgi:DNA-binding response OmpR family regulator
VIRVLHVDDEAPIRLLSRVNLEMVGGMEVIEAANGRTGVELAKREQPDLILLGVMMPGLDGWQTAEELAKDPETREIPIVFLTARAALRDCARGFDLGAVDYILKPFDPTELAPRIRGLLERLERGERDELRRERFSEVRALIVDDLAARATSRADFMRLLDAELKTELARKHPLRARWRLRIEGVVYRWLIYWHWRRQRRRMRAQGEPK